MNDIQEMRQVDIKRLVDQAKTVLVKIHDNLGALGKIAMELRKKGLQQEFLEEFPQMSADFLLKCELVATQQLDKRLVWAATGAERQLLLCSFMEQVEALDGGIKVLSSDGSHLIMAVENIPANLTRQVFSAGKIRTLQQQRIFLDQLERRKKPQQLEQQYDVRQGKVYFNIDRPVVTRKQLLAMLSELG